MPNEFKVLLVKVDTPYSRSDYDWEMPTTKATLIPEQIRTVNDEEYKLLIDFVNRHNNYVLVSLLDESQPPLFDIPKAIAEARKFKQQEEQRKLEYKQAQEKKKAANAKKNLEKLLKKKQEIESQLELAGH